MKGKYEIGSLQRESYFKFKKAEKNDFQCCLCPKNVGFPDLNPGLRTLCNRSAIETTPPECPF